MHDSAIGLDRSDVLHVFIDCECTRCLEDFSIEFDNRDGRMNVSVHTFQDTFEDSYEVDPIEYFSEERYTF